MSLGTGEPESIGSIGGYTLVDRLGSGGMGVVYLARSASGRQVAVKVVHAQYAQDEEFRTRFRQEIAAARRVSGAFTAPVVDADPDAELPWMATLYVPGRTLENIVATERGLSGRALRTLALGLVEALRDIHQAGVVHRDLKPSNVLMAEDGPRVIDFGISRAADNEALTMTGHLIGTPPFMSPEQFASPRDVTAASDVFSLGSLLVYASTGNRPFDGGSPYMTGYQVVHEQPSLDGVPEPLRTMVERCLDKDPAARPQLAELHRMFRTLPDAATGGPPTVPDIRGASRGHGDTTMPGARDTTATRAGGRGRRVRRLVVLGAALGFTVAGVSAYHLAGGPNTTADVSAAAAGPTLPAGWRPWQAKLTRPVKEEPTAIDVSAADAGCVSAGASLYCAGTGFTVARVAAATGRVEWRYGNSAQAADRPLGVRGGIVYVYEQPDEVNADQRVIALDADTGKRVWIRTVDTGHPAALFNGGVLTMSDKTSELLALDARTGKDLWRTPARSRPGTGCAPMVLGGAPYGVCTDAVDPTTGPVGLLRLAPADGAAHEIASLPQTAMPVGALDGQPLFAVRKSAESESNDGRDEPYAALVQVNPVKGKAVRTPLPDIPRGEATLVDGTVYFVRPDGTVTAIRARDGVRLWQRGAQVENLSAPVLSTRYGALYFANRYGRLLALDRDTGAARWSTDKLDDPGNSAANTIPSLLLVKDAIVAVAGDTAFSVRPDRPRAEAAPTAVPSEEAS
ncbi:PQQ-binding-like beta-propeller repeat protein [Streptomyces sp. NPDC005263]|uniref:serine/threonine-protein kinase n=1 Tax=Streptomyces sp. NPDC005263 TaxID=3364711 RepID=UPI0036BE7376